MDSRLHSVGPTTWDQFLPGRIVEYSYYLISHQGIISEVLAQERKIKVIHYGAEHLFATRTIMEDTITVDLTKDNYNIYCPDPKYAHTPQEAIRKARARLGEQDWREGNRSDDFCLSCALKLQKKQVSSWDSLVPGRILQYTYYAIPHQGIMTEVLPEQGKVKVIHYGIKHLLATKTIMEDTISVNLLLATFYIFIPDPEYAYRPQQSIQKAKARLGEQDWREGNRSDDFCRSCVLKN